MNITYKFIFQTPIYTFVGHSESVSGIDWIDNNHFLSCSWDHSIRLWDIQAAGKITQINGSVAFFCLSYSPLNRTVLAGCADRQIKLYDPRARGNMHYMQTFFFFLYKLYSVLHSI